MIYVLNQQSANKVVDWAEKRIKEGKNANLTSNAFAFSADTRGGRQTAENLAQTETDFFDSVIVGVFHVFIGFYKKDAPHHYSIDINVADAVYEGFARVQNISADFDIAKFGDHRVTEEAELELQLTAKSEDIRNLKQLDGDSMVVEITPMKVGPGQFQNNIFKEEDFLHHFGMELYFGADLVPKFSTTYDLLPSYPDNKNDANLPKRKRFLRM